MRTLTFANLVTISGKSMSQIARDCGISLSMVSRMVKGDRIPRLQVVFKLSASLEVPLETVLESFQSADAMEKAA